MARFCHGPFSVALAILLGGFLSPVGSTLTRAETAAGIDGALPAAEGTLPSAEGSFLAAGGSLPTAEGSFLTAEGSPASRFDDSRIDAWIVSGRQQQEAGNHQAAVHAFTLAWQAGRVSHGLYHQNQIPLLESIIHSRVAMADWQAVDNCYGYLELLLTRLYDTDDARLEAGLQAVSSWHINAFNLNLDGKRQQHLRKARRILQLRLQVAEKTLPSDDPVLVFLQQGIQLSELHLYQLSERRRQQLQRQQRVARERLLATLD